MKIVFITCAIFALCDAYAVGGKPKCPLSDGDCQSKIYREIINDIAEKGDPNLGIPPIDPYVIENFDINLLGFVKITMVEGKAIGFKNCHSNSFKTDAEALRTQIDFTCDTFHVEGHHKISTLPVLDQMLGGLKIHGDGEAKLDLENVNMVFDFAYEIVKLDDGEYYLQLNKEDSKHTCNLSGKATFDITNVFVGSQDISTVATAIMNENGQIIIKLFGQIVLDNIMAIFYKEAEKFLKGFPAKNIFSDDLSKYVKS